MGQFFKAMPRTKTQCLDLGSNFICDGGMKLLADGLGGCIIQHLIMSGNRFGKEGFRHFTGALPKTTISSLYLNNSPGLVGAGVQILADALPSSTLVGLDLSPKGGGYKLGDTGVG